MTSIGSTQYPQYPQQPYTPTGSGYTGTGAVNPYYGDGYQASPYSTGYYQGVSAVGGPAAGVSGLATGVSSMASSVGGIFGTIFDLIAGILNTIVNIVVSLVKGVLGLFGIGKKDSDSTQMTAGGQPISQGPSMPLPNNQGMGVQTPAGTPVPPPPPGTDINAAYNVVAGDVGNVPDPNQGIQIVNIHAMKARDYRDKAEQFAKEAEKEARQAAYSAEELQKSTNAATQAQKLAEVQSHKSKAMELLKTAQEYTKAVYDEALYAQAANDILNAKFQGAMANKSAPQVAEAWKNWIGGTVERKFIFFKETIKPAPEVFMASLNAVNANIGRATQVLNGVPAGAR